MRIENNCGYMIQVKMEFEEQFQYTPMNNDGVAEGWSHREWSKKLNLREKEVCELLHKEREETEYQFLCLEKPNLNRTRVTVLRLPWVNGAKELNFSVKFDDAINGFAVLRIVDDDGHPRLAEESNRLVHRYTSLYGGCRIS